MSATADAARVLVLGVPDALDTTLAEWLDGHGVDIVFLCESESVETAQCVLYRDGDLLAASRETAAREHPTHLIVRDRAGTREDLERCQLFVSGALAAAGESVRAVIQTHPVPQTAATGAYDTWLKTASTVRPGSDLSVVWHEVLCATFVDCRGTTQHVDTDVAWRHAARPARIIRHQVQGRQSRNLEYIAASNT